MFTYTSMSVSTIDRDQTCTTSIMRRVRFIYIIRLFATPLALEAAMFIVFATVMYLSVSISNVFANISHLSHLRECVGYVINAFIHTKLYVQIVLGASVILAAFMGREVYRAVIRNIRKNRRELPLRSVIV